MKRNFYPAISSVLIICFFLFLPISGYAGTAKEVNKQIRNAQSLYFKGKIQEADEALVLAEGMVATILAGSDSGEKGKVNRLGGKLKKLRRDIDKKLGKAANTAANESGATVGGTGKPVASTGTGELPSHVVSDLKVVEQYLESAQKSLDSRRIRNASRSLGDAQKRLEQTAKRKKKYFSTSHPQYISLLDRIETLGAKISDHERQAADKVAAAEKATAEFKAASDTWIGVLKPYVSGPSRPEHDPEKYFIASFTEEQVEMAKRAAIYSNLVKDFTSYKETGLGENATDELQLVVRDVKHALQSFEDSTSMMADVKLKEAEQEINYINEWLDKEAAKASSEPGINGLPNTMNKMTFTGALNTLEGAARLVGENEEQVKRLRSKYQEALGKDAELAKLRVEKTRMIGDKFAGSELDQLKQKAGEVLLKAKPGTTMLRATVVSPDWQEESVIEWTDTSRSALRHRITHSVSTQIAGKSQGETTLYTIHVAKDLRVNGSWSQLRGHIMFEDPILEENVFK